MWDFILSNKQLLGSAASVLVAILGVIAAILHRKQVVIHKHDQSSDTRSAPRLWPWVLVGGAVVLTCMGGVGLVLTLAIVTHGPRPAIGDSPDPVQLSPSSEAVSPGKTRGVSELNGFWILEEQEQGGKEVEAGDDAIYVEGGELKWTNKKGTVTTSQTRIKVDSSKVPRTIEMRQTSGARSGEKRLGIYKIDGDTLVIAWADFGIDVRPGEFATRLTAGASRAAIVFTFKRAKE